MKRFFTWLYKPTTVVILFGFYLLWRGGHLESLIGLVIIAVGFVAAYINDAQQVRHETLLAALKPKKLNEIDADGPQFTIHEDYDLRKDNETRTIFPNRFRYEHRMWSGDWMHKSVFEYAIKEKSQVLALVDDELLRSNATPSNPRVYPDNLRSSPLRARGKEVFTTFSSPFHSQLKDFQIQS
jgi:hypothetical protein